MPPRKTSNQNNSFQDKAVSTAPKWAISICGIIIGLSLSLNIANINVSEGINRWLAAKALAVELEVKHKNSPNEISQELQEQINSLTERVEYLEKMSHAPINKRK